MDLVSLILGIICCAKENMVLAIVTLVVSFIEIALLLQTKKDFSSSYVSALFAMAVSVYRICTL